MVIRPRRDSDAADLVDQLRATHERDRYPLRARNVRWDWITQPTGGPAWVAEVNGRAVGHVAVSTTGQAIRGTELSVTRFFVGDTVRGTGTGAALLAAAEDHARQAGVRLVLDVLDGSDAAIRLYEKRGWTRFDTVAADWTRPDGTHPTMHLYRAPH